MNNLFAEARDLTAAIHQQRGTTVGVACKSGLFAITETITVGRKVTTNHLTGWQSYGECLDEMRHIANKA